MEIDRRDLQYQLRLYRKDLQEEMDNVRTRLQCVRKLQKDLKRSALVYGGTLIFPFLVGFVLSRLSDTAVTAFLFGPTALIAFVTGILYLPPGLFFLIRTLVRIGKHRKDLSFTSPGFRYYREDRTGTPEPNYRTAELKLRYVLFRYLEYEETLKILEQRIEEGDPDLTPESMKETLRGLRFYQLIEPPLKP